jgi:hypothetical protein
MLFLPHRYQRELPDIHRTTSFHSTYPINSPEAFMKKALLPILVVFLAMTAQQATAQKLVGVGQLGFGVPLSDFSDRHTAGYLIMAQGRYQLEPELWLTGTLGFQHFGRKASNDPNIEYDGSASVVPVTIGGLYQIAKGEKLDFFASAELGLFFMSYKSTTKERGIPIADVSYSRNDFGLIPGIVAQYPLSDKMKLDVAIKYYWVFGNYKDDVTDITFFGIQAGVEFPLN